MKASDVIIPIITVIVGAILGGTGLVDLVNSYYHQPNVLVTVTPDNKTTNSVATINATNKGSAPATNLKLTLNAPVVIDDYDVNSTEYYEVVPTNSTSFLVLNIPRLVHGQGSLVEINLELENISSTGSHNYIVYATYDQGSLRIDVPSIQIQSQSQQAISSPLGEPLRYIIYAIVVGVIGLFIDRLYKKYRSVRVIDTSPKDGSHNIPTNTAVWAKFDKSLPYSMTSSINVCKAKDNLANDNLAKDNCPEEDKVKGVWKWTTTNVVFLPKAAFDAAMTYEAEVVVRNNSKLGFWRRITNFRRGTKYTWSFTTAGTNASTTQ
jgi:Bacterial Ig-like domain